MIRKKILKLFLKKYIMYNNLRITSLKAKSIFGILDILKYGKKK